MNFKSMWKVLRMVNMVKLTLEGNPWPILQKELQDIRLERILWMSQMKERFST